MPGPRFGHRGRHLFSRDPDRHLRKPRYGYSFSGWTGEGVSDPNSPSITALMDQNRSITATFSLNSYELSLHAGSEVRSPGQAPSLTDP